MTNLTINQQRKFGQVWSGNPFMKALCEAVVLYQSERTLDGFVPQPDIRDRLGDAEADLWDEVCRKMREALGETTDPGQLE